MISVEQCLFGYEDGHRLLASSMPLGDEASFLAELSDLAPGTVFDRSDGYWTGIPAPKIGRYALMRTWPAPEMSRPGCVWTHALLLEPFVLEEVPDLAALMGLARRPKSLSDRNRYCTSLAIETGFTDANNTPFADERIVRDLLTALYDTSTSIVSVSAPGEAESEVFAVWSQQWPRLRRNFRFQTAVTREPRSSSGLRLDVELQLKDRNGLVVDKSLGSEWIDAAAADVADGPNGTLRSFLRRYGQDVRRQRGSFRPLVDIKLLHDCTEKTAMPALLDLITKSFPDRKDAAVLKQDIVDGLLVPSAQLDVLWFVLAHHGDKVFPPPSEAGVARLALLWPNRPQDLLDLAERTAAAVDTLGSRVFDTVMGAVPIDEFWILTASYPRVRERIVEARPELLGSEGVLLLDNTTLTSLLTLIPIDAPIVSELIPRLLSRDDARLANTAVERFPRIVASDVIAAADERSLTIGGAWIQGLVRTPRVLLDPTVMGQITRTSLVFELAEALGWLTSSVRDAGTQPWIAAITDAKSDIPVDKRNTLNTFLIALALACDDEGSCSLLENCFDTVHEQILKSHLSWRARDILSPFLPDIGWVRGWDFGLRLRLAVAAAYIRNGRPVESLVSLTQGEDVRLMLADAAAEVRGGKLRTRIGKHP